jgi:DNA-binding HxlR family transcriptional regulator
LLLLLQIRGFRHATLGRLAGAVAAEGRISQRILRLRMRTLERDGLVRRTLVDEQPPGVRYELTQAGQELAEFMQQLFQWTRRRIPHILASQEQFDREQRATAQSPVVMARTPARAAMPRQIPRR